MESETQRHERRVLTVVAAYADDALVTESASQVVVRPPGFRPFAVFSYFCAGFLLLQSAVTGLAAWGERPLAGMLVWAALIVPLTIGAFWLSRRIWNVAVRIDGDLVVVSNLLRTYRVRASEVVAVDLDRRTRFAVLRFRDGHLTRVGAIRWTFSNYNLDPESPRSVEARLATLAQALGLAVPVMPDWTGTTERWRADASRH